MYGQRTTQTRSRNHCYCRKAIKITIFWVCVALVIQRAKCMRRIIFSSVPRLTLPYFSTFSHKRHDFRKIVTKYKMRVLSETFPILRRIKRRHRLRHWHNSSF
jgi:hypothetical protein